MNATTTGILRRASASQTGWHLLAVATLLIATPLFAADDLVLSNKFGEVTAEIFIPGDVPRLRGLVLHAANYKLKPNDRWAEWGRVIGFGHLSLDIDRKANNRPGKLRAAMDQALPVFAKESGHAELPAVPLVGAGHSAGGWVTQILLKTPERAIAAAIDCAWVVDATKLNTADKSVPMLFTMGAIPDAFKMLPDITNKFVPARMDNWPWALGVQHGCAHAHGPAVVENGVLKIAELPTRARFPVSVKVVAWQFGRGIEPLVQTAQPVEQVILIEKL
jgi:hypothetical protein